MDKYKLFYISWQCAIVLICGITGLIGLYIQNNLPADVAALFAIVFVLCIAVAVFFLIWIRIKQREERENRLIDSIGEPE